MGQSLPDDIQGISVPSNSLVYLPIWHYHIQGHFFMFAKFFFAVGQLDIYFFTPPKSLLFQFQLFSSAQDNDETVLIIL